MKADSAIYSCTCRTLRRAARAVTAVYDECFAPSGLLTTQYAVLSAVERLEPATITELADELALDRTTVTRNLEGLAQGGLLTSHSGQDGRTREVRLTLAGRRRYAEALPLWALAQKTVESRLGTDRLELLLGELRDLTKLLVADSGHMGGGN